MASFKSLRSCAERRRRYVLRSWFAGRWACCTGRAKGILTLAYLSISAGTSVDRAGQVLTMFMSSPWEFSLLVIGRIAAFFVWRRFSEKASYFRG